MHYSTVYVGMDTHKDTFSLCCYTNEKERWVANVSSSLQELIPVRISKFQIIRFFRWMTGICHCKPGCYFCKSSLSLEFTLPKGIVMPLYQ